MLVGEGISLSASGTPVGHLLRAAGMSSLVSLEGLCERNKGMEDHFRGSFFGENSAGDGTAAPWNISGRRIAMEGVKSGCLCCILRQTVKVLAWRLLTRRSSSNICVRVEAMQSVKTSVSQRDNCGLSGGGDFLALKNFWSRSGEEGERSELRRPGILETRYCGMQKCALNC